jgi:hypothetical protein
MTFLQQAEALVRNHPANKELYKPEYSICSAHQELDANCDLCQTGWERCHLEHYLRVLDAKAGWNELDMHYDWLKVHCDNSVIIKFNLTTGAPATEKDAESFVKLVS